MRIILAIIFLFSVCSHVQGQMDTTKVAFVAYWSVGDSYDFKISKTKQQWQGEELTKDNTLSYLTNFSVIDSSQSSYTIQWTLENSLGKKYDLTEDMLRSLSRYELTEIIYKTSHLGEFIEVLNWREVSEFMDSLYEDLIVVISAGDGEKLAEYSELLAPVREIFNSKEGIEQLVLKEVQLIHFPFGFEFDSTGPQFYDEELPNLFGGAPILAKSKIFFEELQYANAYCRLKKEMNLDPKDAHELLLQLFERLNLKDKELERAIGNSTFTIQDENAFEYYFYPGVPIKITTHRESLINIDNERARNSEMIEIELIHE